VTATEPLRDDLRELPLVTVAERMCKRNLSPLAVTERVLARIAALAGRFNAFVTVLAERAMAEAQQERRRFTEAFPRAMAGIDVFVTATEPTAATPLEGDLIVGAAADPEVLAALIACSGPFNLTGSPAMSVNRGFTGSGLPVGMQLVAKPWREADLFAVAHAYEAAAGWQRRLPTEMHLNNRA
jgi:Asp-tRNA(Asn)/Glu-tRNA(Gln) amidotransferase A subunit family amidase